MKTLLEQYGGKGDSLEISRGDPRFGRDFMIEQGSTALRGGFRNDDVTVLPGHPAPVYRVAPDIFFGRDLRPIAPLSTTFGTVILNRCLDFSENILQALNNALDLVSPDGTLIIVGTDKRYGLCHLRDATSFREALMVEEGGITGLSWLLFDAVYNSSTNYDIPSYWQSAPLVEEMGGPYDVAMEHAERLRQGERFDVAFWAFSCLDFLYFLREFCKSGTAGFHPVDCRAVQPYQDSYAVVIKPGAPDDGPAGMAVINDMIVRESGAMVQELSAAYTKIGQMSELLEQKAAPVSFLRLFKETPPILHLRRYLQERRRKRKLLRNAPPSS